MGSFTRRDAKLRELQVPEHHRDDVNQAIEILEGAGDLYSDALWSGFMNKEEKPTRDNLVDVNVAIQEVRNKLYEAEQVVQEAIQEMMKS